MEIPSESKDSLDAMAEATTATAVRRVKAPPKMAPPPEAKATGDDAKGDAADASGGEKKKKKALPPPSNPPPQGTASAAAAFRAKSSLPPPSGPPPTGAAPSASVAKIRGAARPPTGGPPPSGGAAAAPPPGASGRPKMAPPGMAPPPKSDVKAADPDAGGGAKEVGTSRAPADQHRPEAKSSARPPSAEMKPPTVRSAAQAGAKPSPGPTGPVDLLGDASPILDDAIASAPVSASVTEKPTGPTIRLSQPPSASLMRMGTSVTSHPGPSSSASTGSATPPGRAPAPKKSTLEVLNDTNASLTKGPRGNFLGGEDVAEAKRSSTLSSLQSDPADRPSTAAASVATGRAAPFSGSSRPNVPEEEVILVRKQEYKREDGDGEAKDAKPQPHAHDLEDSMEDIEEIPFLEDGKPQPKSTSDRGKMTKSTGHADVEDDDPVIVIESKTTPPPKAKSADAKATAEKKAASNNDEKDDDDALLDGAKNVDKGDIYNELRKLKRPSTVEGDARDPEAQSSASPSPTSDESKKTRGSADGYEDEFKDTSSSGRESSNSSSSRERRERRREKRRSKLEDEPKKIQPQFFNPKSVPFVPDHLLDFVRRPLEVGRGHIIKCFIERNDQSKLAPVYTLLLEVNNVSGRPIMYAKKKGTSRITSHYIISLNKEDLGLPRMMRSHQYVGKLRSSTSQMEYCLYDQGDNPEDLDSDCEVDEELRKSVRAELAVIRYHNTKKPYPRKMEVVIPAIVDNGSSYLDWRPISRDQMMEEHVRAITAAGGQNVLDTQNFTFMHKRETKYDPLSSCIVDFRSRATCTSVKNFQLVHSEPTNEQMRERYAKLHPDHVYEDQGTVSLPQEHVLLQLGKVGKHCFNMDFQYPLSMLQAFAICLSRFDTKQR